MTSGAFRLIGSLVLLGGFLAVLGRGSAVETSAPARNLIDLHAHSSQLDNKQCLACHADVVKDRTLDKNVKTYHRVHLESKLATPKNCADCHQSVDLRNGSAAALRKQVSPELCAACHRGGVEGAKVLFAPQ